MKKTLCIPGKTMAFKTREDEEDLVVEWFNAQTVYSDSIRYLIQKEIAENGIRNLQLFIPSYRDVATIKNSLLSGTTHNAAASLATSQSIHEDIEGIQKNQMIDNQNKTIQNDASNYQATNQSEQLRVNSTDKTPSLSSDNSNEKPKIAKKIFDESVTESYRM